MRSHQIALTVAVTVLAVAPGVSAAATHSCAPTNRTDQFLKADPHGIFGIFKIKVTGTTCAQADKVTDGFYRVQIKRSNAKSRLTVAGFACVLGRPDEAQQLKASCSQGTKRVRFVMNIPNG